MTGTTPEAPVHEGRQRAVAALLGLMALMVPAEVVGYFSLDGGLIVLQSLHQPFAYFVIGGSAFLVAMLLVGRSSATWVVVVTAVVIGLPAFAFAVSGDPERTGRAPAPGRADRELVVERTLGIDPRAQVYVEQGSGLTTRRWEVGRFLDDLADAAWDGPDRIRVTTSGGRALEVQFIELAPDGSPRTKAK